MKTKKTTKRAKRTTRMNIHMTDATKRKFLKLVRAYNAAEGVDFNAADYFEAMIKEA